MFANSLSIIHTMTSQQKPIILSIEGNIGSGKSTLLQHIRNVFPEWNYIDEPVDSWLSMKDEDGNSLLELFYQDKKRWSYTFQSSAYITRYTNMSRAIQNWNPSTHSNVFITERCLLTDRYVFAEMLHEDKDLNALEWNLYTKWFDNFSDYCPIHGLIYVNTDFNVCNQRIKQRGRKGEDTISISYLETLGKQHDKWLSNTNLPILEITSDPSEINRIKDWIQTFTQ